MALATSTRRKEELGSQGLVRGTAYDWALRPTDNLNIAQLEEQEADEAFELPGPTQAMPWEERPEVEDADEEDGESYYNEDDD